MDNIKELLNENGFTCKEGEFNITATKDDKMLDVSNFSVGYVVGMKSNTEGDSHYCKEQQEAIDIIKRFIC
jgi:hypothetical protein